MKNHLGIESAELKYWCRKKIISSSHTGTLLLKLVYTKERKKANSRPRFNEHVSIVVYLQKLHCFTARDCTYTLTFFVVEQEPAIRKRHFFTKVCISAHTTVTFVQK